MKAERFSSPLQMLDPWDGILLVDKPDRMTSHDVVDKIRRHFRIKKVGHGGTLDPMATGLLVLLLGRATRLSNYIMGSDKTYEGTLHLGVTTNSEDVDGKVVAEMSCDHITREQVENEMKKLLGDVMQTPPMISAIKRDGVPLYKLARKGQTVEREPRLIHIYEFTLLDFNPPQVKFRLRCTKGTYVRTLCADIGRALGCGAFLEQLRRTQSGALSLEKAYPLDKLTGLNLDQLVELIIPIQEVRIEEMHG